MTDSTLSISVQQSAQFHLSRYFQRTPSGDLQTLRAAVYWSYGILDRLPAGFQPVQGSLDLSGKTFEFLEIGIKHFHLGALLGEGCLTWADHGGITDLGGMQRVVVITCAATDS